MPDDNRFAGLSEAVDDDENDVETDPAATESASDDAGETADATAVEYDAEDADTAADDESEAAGPDSESSAAADDAASDDDDPTAFPFDATEKKTVYVRPETIADLEDARALVDAQLRTEHDVRDLTGREFYDAVFRLAAADTDALVEELLEAREE